MVSKCHVDHALRNVRYANNSPVYHSITSFDRAPEIVPQRFLVTDYSQDTLHIQQKAGKYYYSLNLQTKKCICERIKERQIIMK